MRLARLVAVGGLGLVACSLAFAQDAAVKILGSHDKADETAIQRIVADASEGWITFDVEKVMSEYADDAYFINAFGRQKNGPTAIRSRTRDPEGLGSRIRISWSIERKEVTHG